MANALKGEAELVAGEATHTLAFDVNALIMAEEASGLANIGVLLTRFDAQNLSAARVLLWAGLQRDHPCHLLEAGEIMVAAGVAAARAAITKGIKAALPPSEAATAENPPPAADGTGSDGTSDGVPKG